MVNRILLSSRPMVLIGLISYPLYLWHWPLLSFARIVESGEPLPWIRALAIGLAFMLAAAIYRFIEQPLRFGRFSKDRRAIGWLVAAMVVLGLVGLLTEQRQGLAKFRVVDSTMMRDLERPDHFRSTLPRCDASYGADDLSWCHVSGTGATEMALLGDSHADHLFPGITAVDDARTWLLIGHSSCPPLKHVRAHEQGRPESCMDKNDRALQAILRTPTIHTVVISSLGGYYLGDTMSPQYTGKGAPDRWRMMDDNQPHATRAEIFRDGLARTITSLQRAGKRVVLFLDTPEFDFWPMTCIDRPFTLNAPASKSPCAVSMAREEQSQQQYRALMGEVKKQFPALLVYDPRAIFCNAEHCVAGKPGMLYFRDTHHLSLRGSRLVANQFIPWLEAQPANKAPAR